MFKTNHFFNSNNYSSNNYNPNSMIRQPQGPRKPVMSMGQFISAQIKFLGILQNNGINLFEHVNQHKIITISFKTN